MASVSVAAFTFMLVVATATAYPMLKEKMTNQDLVKAIRYLWNEELGKDQHSNLWNEDTEKDKDEKGSNDGDREVNVKAKNLWKMERDEDKDRFKTMIDFGYCFARICQNSFPEGCCAHNQYCYHHYPGHPLGECRQL